MPELEVEQSPDAIVMIAIFSAMLGEQALNRLTPEISALKTSCFE